MSQTLATCPICRRPTQPQTRPFCSKRCADVDLGRWFGGDYRVPGPQTGPEDELGAAENAATKRSQRVDPDEGLG